MRCSKRATKVAEANLHELSPVTGKTVVAIKVIAAAIVAHVVAVVTAVTEAATVSVEVKMTEAAIEAQGANDVTPTMIVEDHDRIVLTAQSVQNVQTVTTKAAEIVAQGDPPVVMMVVAADDRVRLADAKLSK